MPTDHHDAQTATPAKLLLKEVWSRGDIPLIDDLVTSDYTHRGPLLPSPITGPNSLKRYSSWVRDHVDNYQTSPETIIVADATVAIEYTASGRYRKRHHRVRSRDADFAVEGVYVGEVSNDRLVTGTNIWQGTRFLHQLGTLPIPLFDTTERDSS